MTNNTYSILSFEESCRSVDGMCMVAVRVSLRRIGWNDDVRVTACADSAWRRDHFKMATVDNYTCLNFSSSDFKIIAGVKASVGVATILMAAATVLTNVVSRKYIFPLHRKVLCTGIATLIDGVSSAFNRVDYFGENDATRAYCVFAGLLNRYSAIATAIATFSMACNIFLDAVFAAQARGYQRVGRRPNSCGLSDWIWPLMIFAFPLTVVWIPFVQSAYGQSPGWPWCTVGTVNDDCSRFEFGDAINIAMFTMILALFGAIVAFYLIIMVILFRRRRNKEVHYDQVILVQKQRLYKEVLLLVLPVLYTVIKFVVIVVNLILNRPGQFVFSMWIVYAAVTPASGFFAFSMSLDGRVCDNRRCLLLCDDSRSGDVDVSTLYADSEAECSNSQGNALERRQKKISISNDNAGTYHAI